MGPRLLVVHEVERVRHFIVECDEDVRKVALKLLNERRLSYFYGDDGVQRFIEGICDDTDGDTAWTFLVRRANQGHKGEGLEVVAPEVV